MTFPVQEPSVAHWRQRAGRALRNPLYRRYFYAQMPLVVGSWIHSIAIGWLMWRLSASPWLLGLLALCDLGPTFLLGPITGTVSDRLDRRRLLICTQAAFIVLVSLLGFLTLTDRVTVETVMLLTLSLGIVAAFDSPTRQAFVAELVGLDDLRNAIALNSMLFNAARLIGPAVGGAIVASFGEGLVLRAQGARLCADAGHAHQTEGRGADPARTRAVLHRNAPRLRLHPEPADAGLASSFWSASAASPACPISRSCRRWLTRC